MPDQLPLTAVPEVAPAAGPLSAVWTRPRAAWRVGLRIGVGSLGGSVPSLYLLLVRQGLLSWPAALALDVAAAAAVTALVTWWTWARRAHLAEMLDSNTLLPWFGGSVIAGLAGLPLGVALSGGFPVVGYVGAVLAVGAWTSGVLVWWGRRHARGPLDSGLTIR